MPKIKIDHIISFSSEDSVHVANNILSNDTFKKWKCQTPGEKNAVVVLQLEKACVISGIDIGNEHSAYVEVLVSRSGTNEDYKVLLVTSSFMTPLEARQSQNVNKVRMFNKEHFSKPECDEKWDRIKVVCSQPFNKHVQYGLSFINIHTTDDKVAVLPTQTHIGKFVLRPESPDNLSVGSLFEKRKQQKQEEKLTGAAAIREASSLASLTLYGSPVCKPKLKLSNSPSTSRRESSDNSDERLKPRDRNELLYSKDEEEPNDKIDKIMESKVKEDESKLEKEKTAKHKTKDELNGSGNKDKKEDRKQSPKPLDTSLNIPSSSKKKDDTKTDENRNRKRKTSDDSLKKNKGKRTKTNMATKPFARLLEDVTLVISGIQNPDRGNLRAHALAMGAKYKADWDRICTHLICAFPNTPKYHQVRGRGKIVTRKWLEDCYYQRKRLPWRRYALDKTEAGRVESEDEICEKVESPPTSSNIGQSGDSDTDFEEQNEVASDTDERIAKIQELQEKQKDVYNVDTDEESPILTTSFEFTKKLENIFEEKKFYIDETLELQVYNKLLKYITAYNGKLIDEPTETADVIITTKDNCQSFKEVNSSALCMRPEWIWNCHNSQKLVPIDEYVY